MSGLRALGLAAFLTGALVLAGCGCGDEARVHAPGGAERASFCVTHARTEMERRTGLGDRASLPPGEGLLIELPVDGDVCIDNLPVVFPIDAAFADTSGTIVRVDRAIAAGDATLRCASALRILEVAAGGLEGVDVGDTLSAPP